MVKLPITRSVIRKLLIAVPVILALTAVSLFMPAQRVSIEGIGRLSFETTINLSVGSEVAYASHSIAKAGTDTSGTGNALTLSFSHTLVAGSNRMVVVSIGVENGDTIDVTSVTYGGVAMTKAIDGIISSGVPAFYYLCEIWYILEADLPSDGANTVQITCSGTANELEVNGFCAEYTGVNQGAPENTAEHGQTFPATIANTISPSDNAWVISAVGAGNSGSFTHGQGQVEVLDYADTSSTFAVAELRGASGETSLDSTFTGTLNRLERVAASFTEAPPAGPTYQSFAVASSATDVTSIAVSKPSGTASGDLLIGVIVTDGNAGTLTPPTTWTLINSGTADPGGDPDEVTLGVWYRIAGDSEPSSYTWSWTNPQAVYAFIIRITGHDSSNPINVFGVATGSSTGASITITSPDVTTTVDDTLVLRIFGADRAMNFGSYPAGHTGITFGSSSGDNTTMYQCTGGAAWQTQATAGATGSADFTAIPNLSATEEWRALTVAIAPPAAAPDISNLPSTKDFGVVTAGSTPNTGNAYFTITNSSTMTIDIYIKCDGWSPTTGTNSWTYGSPIGADQGFLEASSADGGAGGSQGEGLYDVEILNGTDTLLCDDVATTTNPTWELQLNAPSSFTHGDEQQTTVTLTATAS